MSGYPEISQDIGYGVFDGQHYVTGACTVAPQISSRVNDGVPGDDGGDGSNWVWQFGLEARRRRPAGGETAGGEKFGRFLRG